ncbi:MAG: bifunctional folylpolyglutamate synthase/dihydrofolate synthase [Nitrospiraceae bacterium]|nr:MAG: bifunctional folylpolyglutamate synthase/dihydrofolate synthase [Nitrospiraceae bacterium]
MGYAGAIDYLYGLQKHGIKLGLDNTVRLLSLFNNPQEKFHSIHVAGTNGKGSTSAMIASILQSAGFRIGLFTSPHLVSFTERIRINNEEITEEEVVELTEDIRSAMEGSELNPTFFEFVTVMAFLYFKRKNVDWAVVETGMGGRLDATNVLLPEASVITSINYDHSEFLGNTISAIAEEKAGIIKNGTPVITSAQEPSAMNVIERRAGEKNAGLFVYGRNFSAAIKSEDTKGSVFDYNGGSNIDDLVIPLPGRHQVLNVALALKTIEIVSKKSSHHASCITHHAISAGLENIKWQGRLELVSKEPLILIDGAHNPDAAKILADSLKEIFIREYGRIILIAGIMSDKDARGIMEPLLPLAAEIILTAPAYERAASPQKLAECAAEMGFTDTHIAPTVREAIAMAVSLGEIGAQRQENSEKNFTDSLILITGSFYTIGEAKEILCGRGILSGLRETR